MGSCSAWSLVIGVSPYFRFICVVTCVSTAVLFIVNIVPSCGFATQLHIYNLSTQTLLANDGACANSPGISDWIQGP